MSSTPNQKPAQIHALPKFKKLTHLRALVVEDNTVNQMVIEGMLNKLGIECMVCSNGEIAVNTLIQNTPISSQSGLNLTSAHLSHSNTPSFNVILMDCEMPVMDGFEATCRIREWEKAHQLPPHTIIALTAHTEAEHRQRVFDGGMDLYLSKPVTLSKLQETLAGLTHLSSVIKTSQKHGYNHIINNDQQL